MVYLSDRAGNDHNDLDNLALALARRLMLKRESGTGSQEMVD